MRASNYSPYILTKGAAVYELANYLQTEYRQYAGNRIKKLMFITLNSRFRIRNGFLQALVLSLLCVFDNNNSKRLHKLNTIQLDLFKKKRRGGLLFMGREKNEDLWSVGLVTRDEIASTRVSLRQAKDRNVWSEFTLFWIIRLTKVTNLWKIHWYWYLPL